MATLVPHLPQIDKQILLPRLQLILSVRVHLVARAVVEAPAQWLIDAAIELNGES